MAAINKVNCNLQGMICQNLLNYIYAIEFNIAIDQTLKLGTWLLNFHEKRSTEGQKYQTKI